MGKSVSEIKAIREQTMQALGNRVGNDDGIIYIMTCCGTGCTSSGSLKDRERLLCGRTDNHDFPRKYNVYKCRT